MSAIVVENLSKRYVIGHQTQADTLRDALSGGVRSLWNRLRRQRHTREEFHALRDVSFSVEPGEVVGIIGRNGAGKSTLLKILSRITEPTTGRIELNGRVASLLEVGTGFHPELSGRENIFLNGAILGMSRAEIRHKFDEIVAFSEVEKFLDTPVKRYSSGMYVRLAFAVAAHLEPEILIVDEVLAVGDVQFQKKCLGKMRDVSLTQGRTVLFVSHNLAAVRQLCPRVIFLASGRLVREGPSAEIIAEYEGPELKATEFTRFAPGEVLPGLRVEALSASCSPADSGAFSDLILEASGSATATGIRFGFGIQIEAAGGVRIARIGARQLDAYIPGDSGPWSVRLRLPEINRLVAGGELRVQLLVNPSQSSGLAIPALPLLVRVPEADPYECGVNFESERHGLVALPTVFERQPTP